MLAGTGKSFTPHILTVNAGEVLLLLLLIISKNIYSFTNFSIFPGFYMSSFWMFEVKGAFPVVMGVAA